MRQSMVAAWRRLAGGSRRMADITDSKFEDAGGDRNCARQVAVERWRPRRSGVAGWELALEVLELVKDGRKKA